MILHPDDEALFARVKSLAFRASAQFGLPLKVFEPKRLPGVLRGDGVCYVEEGRVGVSLRFRGSTGHAKHPWCADALPVERIVRATAHQLAWLQVDPKAPRLNRAAHRAWAGQIEAYMLGLLNEPDVTAEALARSVAEAGKVLEGW